MGHIIVAISKVGVVDNHRVAATGKTWQSASDGGVGASCDRTS